MTFQLPDAGPLALRQPGLLVAGHRIGGSWRTETSGARLAVINPAAGERIAILPDGDSSLARDAVDAAGAAFSDWRACSPAARAQALHRWHAAILEHAEDLACLISLEQGKPIPEARAEVAYAASYVDWFAAQAMRGGGEVLAAPSSGSRLLSVREPLGVVAAITPWNFPAAMLTRKVAPALAAGNTVVAKPSEETPLTAIALVQLACQAGMPEGVLNLVVASRSHAADVVDAWLADERVRKLTFTGSTAVGRHLASASANTLKRLSLELGGNAPFIVFADADVAAAIDGLMRAKFRNAGQTCISPNRILVERSVYAEFVDRLAARVMALRVGPAGGDSDIGPLINTAAVNKVQRHVANAQLGGARLVAQGRVPAGAGNFFAPTLLADVTDSMECACEETFGPVIAVSVFADEKEAVRRANSTPFGLAAYFYSGSRARCHRVGNMLEAGMVGVNETAISHAHVPFGGVKQSGYGREGSELGLHDYQQVKYLCESEL